MANALFDKGREAFLNGDIDWANDDIRVILLDSDYTVNLSTHDFLDDVGGTGRVATSAALTGKSSTNGTADAADVTFSGVTNASNITHFLIYKHTGTESTSQLIAHFDTATNMPLTPNGGDVTIQWDSGANKIFTL